LLAAPVLVPLSMAGAFSVLNWWLGPRRAYNLGFALYWAGWCTAFPLWAIREGRALRLMCTGNRPSGPDAVLLLLPVAGAVITELVPNRRHIGPRTAAVMLGTAVVNAAGEELLWRAAYVGAIPDDVWRGAVWPRAGFTMWHLAPQVVLPSRHGRARFTAAAALVGAAATRAAWAGRGVPWVLTPHILTDACGARADTFRLAPAAWAAPPGGPAGRVVAGNRKGKRPWLKTRPDYPCRSRQPPTSTVRSSQRTPLQASRTAFTVGGIWTALTIGFEFGFGHYVAKEAWPKLLRAYNVSAGELWPAVPLWAGLGPEAIRRITDRGQAQRRGALLRKPSPGDGARRT
jgi:hypothetical protein